MQPVDPSSEPQPGSFVADDSTDRPQRSLARIFRHELAIWLPIAVLCFFLASLVVSGWPAGLSPEMSFPYNYGGDGLSYAWTAQRVLENLWYFDNARSGFPFGSNYLDYPIPDSGSLVLIKILGQFLGSWAATLNIYILLSFPVTFAVSFAVMRYYGISRAGSVSGALVFVFIPFHFERFGHMFYTWYFVVPLFFYLAHRLFFTGKITESNSRLKHFAVLLLLLVLASFGAYYAFFGVLLILSSCVAGAIRNRSAGSLYAGILASAIIILGFTLNLAPNIQHRISAGENAETPQRSAVESEYYGLKLTQLLLPRENHRIKSWREFTANYYRDFPLNNENIKSTLGLVGSTGLILLMGAAFMALAGKPPDPRLSLLAVLTLTLVMFATIGGFSSFFAIFVSPMIRAWNRASIFIGFASISTVFILVDTAKQKYSGTFPGSRIGVAGIIICIGVFALWDQTRPTCQACAAGMGAEFQQDQAFIKSIEQSLPIKAAIYQLPYMPFPETPPLHGINAYEHLKGFLHSKNLRWSFGGIRGRIGELFYRALSRESIADQVEIIRRLGFSGIYLDRRGYADGGKAIESSLQEILSGGPQLSNTNGNQVFFRVQEGATPIDMNQSLEEIMRQARFWVNKQGVGYQPPPQ